MIAPDDQSADDLILMQEGHGKNGAHARAQQDIEHRRGRSGPEVDYLHGLTAFCAFADHDAAEAHRLARTIAVCSSHRQADRRDAWWPHPATMPVVATARRAPTAGATR